MSDKIPSDWTIELRQLPILGGFYAHNYWVMLDGNRNPQGEINGFSSVFNTNTRQWDEVAVGLWGDTLRGYSRIEYANTPHQSIYQYKSSESDVRARFQAALKVNDFLNTKNIRYQPWLWYSSEEQNSNAWATTMGVAMGFNDLKKVSDDSLIAPGWGYNLLSEYPEGKKLVFNPEILEDLINYCFTAETPILMSDGTYKPIEQVKIGDEVMAFNGLGKLEPRKVTQTFITPDQEVVQLGNIKVTLGQKC